MSQTANERDRWLQAGLKLSKSSEIRVLTEVTLCAEAGLQESGLRRHFVDFRHFLIQLQQHFLDLLRASVNQATRSLEPGHQRLKAGAEAYLDQWLEHPGLRHWFGQARKDAAEFAEGLRSQNQAFSLVLSTEFHAMSWPHPLAGARLFTAALQEVARAEHASGQKLPAMRDEIWEYIGCYGGAR